MGRRFLVSYPHSAILSPILAAIMFLAVYSISNIFFGGVIIFYEAESFNNAMSPTSCNVYHYVIRLVFFLA